MSNKQKFIELYKENNNAAYVASEIGIHKRKAQRWAKEWREQQNIVEKSPIIEQQPIIEKPKVDQVMSAGNPELNYNIKDGVIVVLSDPHVIPNQELSIAAQALLVVIKILQPTLIVENGDIFDFASISKHDKLGWGSNFTVKEELEAGMDLLKKILDVSPDSHHIAIEGNHCTRFNKLLSKVAPQFKGVPGFNLTDHFPVGWKYAMSISINNNTIFLHSHLSGVHAAYNNTLRAGRNVITGHTHLGIVNPITDYNGTRFGVQVPTLASIQNNPLFAYTNGTVLNWQSGFAVLTYIDYELQYPELCLVNNKGKAFFRGEIINI